MLLSKQPLNRTENYNSVETSVNSDGEHSKSLADKEGDYAEASELYSRSLEIREESEGKLKGILGCTKDDVVLIEFEGNIRLLLCRKWMIYHLLLNMLRDGLNVRVRVERLTDSGNIFLSYFVAFACCWVTGMEHGYPYAVRVLKMVMPHSHGYLSMKLSNTAVGLQHCLTK
ncbi:hypothetical protein RHSIM_Rhsim07G0156000 [Rhododendron simsii]|uniref:Uncharacterized protein n=1 Tax=Rhododendron simsii TaxID=118357 RepID=A0A834H113_RHOSS|nr:hypothetical protein RHSIM_Rhsim07G0156000 [Rhododendron simsii]